MSDSNRSRSSKKLEELFEKVRSKKQYGGFGWLDDLLTEELADLERLIREEALEERGRLAASEEADFSPSGLSALRASEDAARGESEEKRADTERDDSL